jgi:hypothetical protein
VRRSLPILLVLLTGVAACNQAIESPPPGDGGGSADDAVTNASELAETGTETGIAPRARRETGPDISPQTAPGVAFAFRYSFRLAAERVAEAQQEHQRLCERYGVARCRITGMTYRAASEDDVAAMLTLRVDPAIAGQFGRESVQAVLNADGTLTDSQIDGTQVGDDIRRSGRTLAELTARLEEVEVQLRTARPRDKGQLEYEAAALREQIRGLRDTREGQQSALATTPIQLNYGSGDLAPGPAPAPSLREALSDTGDDFLYSLTVLLVVLVRLLPWALVAGLGWVLVRYLRRRIVAKAAAAGEPALGA